MHLFRTFLTISLSAPLRTASQNSSLSCIDAVCLNIQDGKEDLTTVQTFFDDKYLTYRKIVENNIIFHKEFHEFLDQLIDSKFNTREFSFLDVACGDASLSSKTLSSKPNLKRYVGVDFSSVSLDFARKNTDVLQCPKTFIQGDFLEEINKPIRNPEDVFDIIFVGLSIHHLRSAEKLDFLKAALKKLAPSNGILVIYEPVFPDNTTRERYYIDEEARMREYNVLTDEEIVRTLEHMTNHDFPEEVGVYGQLSHKAGFKGFEVLFQPECEHFALMKFSA